MCPTIIWEKVWSRSNTWGDLFGFCGVLKGSSFFKSAPETCHKKCVQGTFWNKLGAGPRPGGTYPIFVKSRKGDHFASQAQKPVTRDVPNERFGKSWEQVQDLGGLTWFLSGPEKGGHFAKQAHKPLTRNVPIEHFGKSDEQVQHLARLI